MADSPSGKKPWWSFLLRRPMHYVLDAFLLFVVLVVAFLFRFEFDVPESWAQRGLAMSPVVVGLQLVSLRLSGVYNFIWRYVGLRELMSFVRAMGMWTLPLVVVRFLPHDMFDLARLPISILAMDSMFAFFGVVGLRVARRGLYEAFERSGGERRVVKKRVLLLGAGRAGALAAREILGRNDSDLDIRGFVDDDPEKQDSVLNGITVLGTTVELPQLVKELAIDHIVITIAKASRQEFRRILDICEAIPVRARVIPGLYEILQGHVSVNRIRDVQVEDLLGREPIQLDDAALHKFLTDRIVVVTGAGGSIGSELARQVARFNPTKLLLLERAEGALFDIDRELRASHPSVSLIPVIADVGDEARIDAVFSEHKPHVILHAAAHKHVPMMEKNPGEAIKNNVGGTRTVARLAGLHGADAFVLISTDKAVRPTSVMGASKRAAELVVQDLNGQFSGTRFVAVRFGNVLGSAGSVIPIFREQIRKGGPVTITHPEMVRFFMTIPEASQLVLQAGAMGEGGEIFVLDMGEPVKIVDLAKDMVRLSGLRPFEDIDIVFTGIRPGEKLYEELQATGEELTKTRHPKIFIGKITAMSQDALEAALAPLWEAAARSDGHAVRAALASLVPESKLSSTGIPPLDPNSLSPMTEAQGRPARQLG